MDTIMEQDGQIDSSPLDPVHRLCLAGLTVLPIPDVENICNIFKDIAQLITNNNSTQETLIYRNATTAHLDAFSAHIDTARDKALADYLDAINSLNGDPIAALRATSNYHDAIDRDGTYPGLLTFFGDESGLLFFKMSSTISEIFQCFLHNEMIVWAHKMDLPVVHYTPSVTHKRVGHSQLKQAKSIMQPAPPRWIGDHFPTVVIEVGNNHMLLCMEKDWWFDNSVPHESRGDVKIVVVVKVERPAKRILIELWDRHHSQPFQTVTITPHSEESLSTEIVPPATLPLENSRWTVEGAPMVIPFEPVFLRPKQDGETDLVIAEPTFFKMARQCWQHDLMGA